MFTNIGGKIKTTAAVCCWIVIIASVISGIAMMFNDVPGAGLLTIIVGPLVGWLSSFMLYGFGELVENSCIMANLMAKQDAEKNRE